MCGILRHRPRRNHRMSAVSVPVSSDAASSRLFRTDSLAVGMVVMLAMTVVGRGIGFLRGMAFCRLMDDVDVGRWSMAFGFITLITPVMLLGIPGALPRFTEHFRVRGSLSSFVRRIAIGTLGCSILFLTTMMVRPDWFGYLVFLQPQDPSLIHAVAAAVVGMIVYNFVSDLCGSLRQVRVVSVMQFLQGVGFTTLSVVWLACGGDFTGVVWMFAAACLLATPPGLRTLIRQWPIASGQAASDARNPLTLDHDTTSQDEPGDRIAETSLWWMIRRLAPYAAALWMMNLIGNCFELSDRYMILHFIPDAGLGRDIAGQSAVGQYHSGRIIPMLLLSLGTMIGGVMMPYLAADWESGRPDRVRRQLGDAMLALSVVFTAGGAMAVWIGPWLFGTLLQGRYNDGLTLMPLAMCFCTWAALVTVGQNYLWTAEKGKWVAVAMTAGLATNLGFNALLLPVMGLQGAVVATLISHAVVMIGVWTAMVRCGYAMDRWLFALSVLPATLLVSPIVAMAAATGLGVVAVRHRWTDVRGLALSRFGVR